MKLSCALACAVLMLMVCGCSTGVGAEEGSAAPAPTASESPSPSPSPSASPSTEVNRRSAQSICERLRLRDAYLAREDSLSDVERDQVIVMEVEAMLEARKDDAEPGLREIVWDQSVNDRGPTIERMIGWCQENTEPVGDTAPW